MATKALEARFKHLSVQDENSGQDGTNLNRNSKVSGLYGTLTTRVESTVNDREQVASTGTHPSDRLQPPESSKSNMYKQQCTIIDPVASQVNRVKGGKVLRPSRKPLSVISTQRPDEVVKAKEHNVTDIDQQSTTLNRIASKFTQAKDQPASSRTRHPLSAVMSLASVRVMPSGKAEPPISSFPKRLKQKSDKLFPYIDTPSLFLGR
ncbi:kinase-like protein [Penicillium verrucosum]|uniref:kinase-like protein n=1 Tax=Penicillium verrucosum TaxID=60171 RepID=UPI0025458310|nr:kinase-like protein [Penicillium verrucosum]KAJ5927629.1 kinase-like protein [Penicillium verrucosum]